MPNITNQLDQFQSHSIHYVVLAARSTEDVRVFTADSPLEQSRTLSAIDQAQALGDEVIIDDASSVYLMLDTRRFSQFTVDNFELETYITGFSVPGSNTPNATGIGMKFTVLDSIGISFANFLQYLMDQQLQVSYDGMTVLVRILFIGHLPDGRSETVQSITIPAMFKQIQVDLNESKGVYQCTLFPLIGLASNSHHNSKWTAIGTASSYFTGAQANTLGAMVTAFETRLNVEAAERYKVLNAQIQTDGIRKEVQSYGRPVKFMITMPPKWSEFKLSGPAAHDGTETNFKKILEGKEQDLKVASEQAKSKQSESNVTSSHIAVDPNLTITEVLDVIFSQTSEVSALGNFTRKADEDGMIRFYKHLITVTSDDDSFMVHVDVVEFVVPNVDLQQTSSGALSAADSSLYIEEQLPNGSIARIPRLFVEYDYLFSGTNIDVLSLDLKIENLNIMLMQGTKLGRGELMTVSDQAQDQRGGKGPAQDKRVIFGLRDYDPVLIPSRTQGQRTNFAHLGGFGRADNEASLQALNQQYISNLSAYYSAGPVDAKLTVRGNPDLMAAVSLQAMPAHVRFVSASNSRGEISDSARAKYRADFEEYLLKINGSSGTPGSPVNSRLLTGSNYLSSPFFVKVNVFGPRVDFKTNEPLADGDFAQQLFYDNFYIVDKAITKIDQGKFTQEISLRSFSIYSFPTITKDDLVHRDAQGVNPRDRR